MRIFGLIALFALSAPLSFAYAQDDAAVTDIYHDYLTALKDSDDGKAEGYASEAYSLAEQTWGESRKETGFLAGNYADRLSHREQWRRAAELYDRCAEILRRHADTFKERIHCKAGAANARRETGDEDNARAMNAAIIESVEAIADKEQWAAAAAGEAYLQLAMISETQPLPSALPVTKTSAGASLSMQLNQTSDNLDLSTQALAQKAINFFELAFDGPVQELAQAHKIAGNFAESEKEYFAAEEHYRAAFEILKAVLGEEAFETIQMSGRVAFMELYTKYYSKQPKPTRQPSGDNCSVTVRDKLEIEYCEDMRVPPDFPSKALLKGQEGFVLVRYDINEKGRVENERVVHSWPGGVFDERTLKAMATWKFRPPTDQYGNVVSVSDVETRLSFVVK